MRSTLDGMVQEMEQLRKEQQALAAAKEKREQQAAAKKQKSAAAAKARRLQNAAAAATVAAAAHAMHSSLNSVAVGQGQTAVVQSAAVGIVQVPIGLQMVAVVYVYYVAPQAG
jgi:hypothetical protein